MHVEKVRLNAKTIEQSLFHSLGEILLVSLEEFPMCTACELRRRIYSNVSDGKDDETAMVILPADHSKDPMIGRDLQGIITVDVSDIQCATKQGCPMGFE